VIKTRATTFPALILLFLSIVLVAFSSNTPDADAYLAELDTFEPSQFRLDYLSWVTLWAFNPGSVKDLHFFAIFILLVTITLSLKKRSSNFYALSFLMPMIVGSQVRLLLAASVFLLILELSKTRLRYVWAAAIASGFHFSFIFFLFFPITLISSESLASLLPDMIARPYEIKLNSYIEKEAVAPSPIAFLMLLSTLIINAVILYRNGDARYLIVSVYIVIYPLVGEDWWMTFRRSCEVMLFFCFPFYRRAYRGLSLLNVLYFALLTIGFALNLFGYASLVWR